MRHNARVVFVGGAGHSGSTLLGLVLGAHPSVFYAGEANKSRGLGDASVKLRKRTCKVCGETCRVWSGIEARDVDLYEALSRRTERASIADSTKSIAWIDEQLAVLTTLGVALHLFVLGRDGRAVLASSLRKRPETSARDHAIAWADRMRATEALASRFPGGVTRVRYELLATRTDATIEELARALALDVVPAMRDPWSAEQHPLGGNAGTLSFVEGAAPVGGEKRAYYAAHPRTFLLDTRWKRELSARALADFDEAAGETNRPYAWELDA
jgi:hypothetical protein